MDAADLGTSAVDALVVLWDPGARISLPLWDHTEPLALAVAEALTATAEAEPEQRLAVLLEELRADPLALEPRAALARAVTAAASAGLRHAVAAYRSEGAVFPVTGSRSEEWTGPPAPAVPATRPRDRLSADAGSWELTVVVDFRAAPGDQDRLRNVMATLRGLEDQTLDPSRFRVVVVEQDVEPRHRRDVAPLADAYVHIPYGGPYNRSRGHNVGAAQVLSRGAQLCFLDADMLVGRGFLEGLLASGKAVGAAALLPYDRVIYLDRRSSARAVGQRFGGGGAIDPASLHGYHLTPTTGGCLLLGTGLFEELGGYDERFEGWGDEDNEFFHRVDRAAGVTRLRGDLYHLDHSRPPMRPPAQDVPPVRAAEADPIPVPLEEPI